MPDPERRRRRRRELSGGQRQSTETHDGVGEDLDIFAPATESPSEINDRVATMAAEPAQTIPVRTTQPIAPESDDEEFTPQNRMKDVKTRASAYEREYRLKLLHRMLLRQVPIDKIADELAVSVHTVIRDRKELYKRLREEASKMDMNELIGNTMGFYNEIQGMALRTASNAKSPMNMRLAALRTALGAKNDSHKFMQAAGVFDVLTFQAGEDSANSSIERLVGVAEKMLSDEDDMANLADDMGVSTELYDEEDTDENIENDLRFF